jgi:O-antigen ligase
MATPNLPRHPLALLILAGTLIGIPWLRGGTSPAGQAALALLVSLAAVAHLLTRAPSRVRLSPPILILALFAAGAGAGTMHVDRTIQALLVAATYLAAGLLAYRGTQASPMGADVLSGAVIVSGLIWTGSGVLSLWRGNGGGMYGEVLVGPFDYPNAMAAFLLLTGGVAGSALASWRGASRMLAGTALAAAVAGIHMTGSRGAALATLVGVLVFVVLRWGTDPGPRALWAGAGAVLLTGWAAWRTPRFAGLLAAAGATEPTDTSILWRLSMLQWTWDMICDHPWLGVGPGAFPVALTHYQRLPYVSGENPHNLYLQVAAEYGLPAAAAALLIAAVFLVRLGRVSRGGQQASDGASAAALAGTLTAFLVHSAVDMGWTYPAIGFTAAIVSGLAARHVPARRGATRLAPALPRSVALAPLAVIAAVAVMRSGAASLVEWGNIDLEAAQAPASAARAFYRATAFNPASFAAHRGLSRALQRAGDPDSALTAAQRAVATAPLDPNTHALAGEVAAAGGRWQLAQSEFHRAVELAPAASLRFHAQLVDALRAGGRTGEALLAYTRAATLFTPERVIHAESRCLMPGDRYLLAHMSWVAAALYREVDDAPRRVDALRRAGQLARPDDRGICGRGGPRGRSSPEATVASFWDTWSPGDASAARAHLMTIEGSVSTDLAALTGARVGWHRVRVARVASLTGNERQAVVISELDVGRDWGSENRCSRASARWTADGWFLDDWPSVSRGPCKR